MKHTEFGHSITFIAQDWNEYPDFMHRNKSTIGDYDSDIQEFPNITDRSHLDKNTWESWGLIPESRPTPPPPPQKVKTAEIQNVDGNVDLSWSVNPYPVFSKREGSFKFLYNPIYQMVYNKYKPWLALYSEILEFLHGKKLRMILEDDPGYYYEGRFWVESWDSKTDGSGSGITISYSVMPYKMSILSSLDQWLWDPFNFYTDYIPSNIFDITIPIGSTPTQKKELYKNFIKNPNMTVAQDYWYPKHGDGSDVTKNYLNLFGLVGSKPQIPIIHWTPSAYSDTTVPEDKDQNIAARLSSCLIVNYLHYSYGIKYYSGNTPYKYFDPLGSHGTPNSLSSRGVNLIRTKTVGGVTTYSFKDNDMIFSDSYMGEYQFIQFIGYGNVKIDFNRGAL